MSKAGTLLSVVLALAGAAGAGAAGAAAAGASAPLQGRKRPRQPAESRQYPPPSACADDPGYSSRLGLSCADHAGIRCDALHLFGLGGDEIGALLRSCPMSCGASPCEAGTWPAAEPFRPSAAARQRSDRSLRPFPWQRCQDNPAYVSRIGFDCSAHRYHPCDEMGGLGFTTEDMEELRANCPESCGVVNCEERAGDGSCFDGWNPVCQDDSDFVSRLGLTCEDHSVADCTALDLLGFTDEEVTDLIIRCPCSCGIKCGEYTYQPTAAPTELPTSTRSAVPSVAPSAITTNQPSRRPSDQPSVEHSLSPSVFASSQPSDSPSAAPTSSPTLRPSAQPSIRHSSRPSNAPSSSSAPSSVPTIKPSTTSPTLSPTGMPTQTRSPSAVPSLIHSSAPSRSKRPSAAPSDSLSERPSALPTRVISSSPSVSFAPSNMPSHHHSESPSQVPSQAVSKIPSEGASDLPSKSPSAPPSHSVMPSTPPTTNEDVLRDIFSADPRSGAPGSEGKGIPVVYFWSGTGGMALVAGSLLVLWCRKKVHEEDSYYEDEEESYEDEVYDSQQENPYSVIIQKRLDKESRGGRNRNNASKQRGSRNSRSTDSGSGKSGSRGHHRTHSRGSFGPTHGHEHVMDAYDMPAELMTTPGYGQIAKHQLEYEHNPQRHRSMII